MTIFVDIDGTICTLTDGHYGNAKPIHHNIAKVNRAFDAGHMVVYWTGRGTTTGKNWKNLTEKQLKEWGCKYHDFLIGKPYYDLFIDDKSCRIEEADAYIN